MELNLRVSPVYAANKLAEKKIVINQGGTRSGKTYSILQLLLEYCFTNTGKIVDVVRKTQSELWGSALLDWIEILHATGVYRENNHHKTKNEFYINGNLIRFYGIDKAQKRRGQKRDILFINEANGLTLEDWVQLSVRTRGKIYIDFNPSEYFWLNEFVLEKRAGEYDFIKSTYKDNYDFLTPENIREIEALIDIDDYYYNVYVLGELVAMKGKIFEKYNTITPAEYEQIDADTFYGLDFGWDHPMALMEIKHYDGHVFERELFCESRRTDDHLIEFMQERGISYHAEIYADPAMPSSIEKIANAGYNVHKAKKDVSAGLRFCQQLRRSVTSDSTNHLKMLSQYKWKQTASGVLINEPVKINDDCPDAIRYGEYSHLRHAA